MAKGSCFVLFRCLFVLLLATTFSSAQTFTTLDTFNGTNGANPAYGALVQGANGLLYGTTSYGGSLYGSSSGCPNPYGCGTIFDINTAGKLATLDSFSPNGGPAVPLSGLIQYNDGSFYGTTNNGGTYGCGTVFKVGSLGALTTLYNFACDANGGNPQGGLVQASNGYLYGTTTSYGQYANGTVFKINPTSGALTTFYSFCSQDGCPDGAFPAASLIQGSDGNLYGTTSRGNYGMGTVFKMTLSGQLSTLYSFCSVGHCLDGNDPMGALVEGPDGNYYGTVIGGGNGVGLVYKITPSGQYTILHTFDTNDGALPTSTLIYASDGNFYGTTQGQSDNGNYGNVFKMTPSGTLTSIYNFCSQQNCADGQYPYAGVTQDTDGVLYGTTYQAGDLDCSTMVTGCGTIFSINAGLPAFIEARPNLGGVGSTVILLGRGLTAATGVTFNGKPATFKIVSGTEIKATVPTGATTGKVKVTLASGSLSTVLNFTVK